LFFIFFVYSLRDKLVFVFLRATGFVSSIDRSARFLERSLIKSHAKHLIKKRRTKNVQELVESFMEWQEGEW
jgi:hypothetical protein